MRRFDDVWLFHGGVLTDVTQTLGDGTAPITMVSGDKLYLGSDEWAAGAYVDPSVLSAPLGNVWEAYDADAWRPLSQKERYDQLQVGYARVAQGFDFGGPGVAYWGKGPATGRTASQAYLHATVTPSATGFPESVAVPETEARYWVRLRITSGSVQINRVLPRLYNSYVTVDQVASFLGLPAFDDTHSPTRDTVRDMIVGIEDWLDSWTHKTWRLQGFQNDMYDFNPAGFILRVRPGFVVSQIRIWDGTSFHVMEQGRGKDYWYNPELSMVTFTFPSFRMRQYSAVLNRSVGQPGSVQVDWVAGGDYETDPRRTLVWDTVVRRVCADLVTQSDWTGLISSGLEVLPKADKIREWAERAQQQADELRGLVTV